ncbi:pyridoxal-5-phosphate-dependent protein subunit beta [Anoxybacter fermentans]|uniref:Pyridoxal-5-phosphate-dependent protein subunit beta n=1 Tax=Anoxybacter fermentans TaxID=1323375 RepID=A0A3S9SXQ7_9FIRM|nr:pyridoxal-phosphate dependent enzyme [Anoxybacter fermentans]AZR73065.1 pyridoxal-5-phosphate-dependent protein subunit beta [Anoxybacter fermentans]
MIDLTINEEQLQRTVKRAREKNIIMPTFKEMQNPELIPDKIKEQLKEVGLWDINPLNLFRITWKNEPKKKGGLYDGVNYIEIPKEITGVDARIIALIGKWFPTGAHKVGASYGCLVPRLVTGQFDPTRHKAVWPSTGNYCRGGAYNSTLLACDSIAILPEGMSKERFEWLSNVAGEVIATPGTESNVKEIYDKCWELRRTRDDVIIFNQFDEFGNYLWHYHITGRAMEEVFNEVAGENYNFAGVVSSTGSAGTIACGDYLKKVFPNSKIIAGEALQCPTLLMNGYGEHRIEGIGDKHVPWIHNVKNTDIIVAVDDNIPMNLIRLFNEPVGQEYLRDQGVPEEFIEKLSWIGISGVANIICAIKFAKYYELTSKDVVMTVCTDSMELYGSRLKELEEQFGRYTREDAVKDYHRYLMAVTTDHMIELTYIEKKRIHNLKYYTWIEQQGKDVKELNAQWYDPEYWERIQNQVEEIDKLITEFNERTGLLKSL